MSDKVIVIGIDSATWDLLLPWMEEGRLPNLQRLMRQGVWTTLESTFPPLSPAAWTSMATGKNPGSHGILDHIVRKGKTYDFSPINSHMRGSKALWQILSEANKKVGIINVPLTYPPEKVNGFMISGMYTPSEDHVFTYPPSIIEELNTEIGGYTIFGKRSKENLDVALEGYYQVKANRLKACLHLMKNHEWDFFFIVFNATDFIQHRFWRFMDTSHPLHEKNAPQKYRDAIPDFYQDLDKDLAKIFESLDDRTTQIIMSDHGAGPLLGYLYLNNWLLSKGFLTLKKNLLTRLKYSLFRWGLTPFNIFKLFSRLKLSLTDKTISRVKTSLAKDKKWFYRFFLTYKDIDWARTKAFALGSNLAGIYINQEGRDEKGIVKPGEEFESLRSEIADELRTISDPSTGENIVQDIYFRDQLYTGKCVANIPDIIFSFKGDLYMTFGMHEFASNRIIEPSLWFSGSHKSNGILMMKGADVKEGEGISRRGIVDLAPTILYMLGLEVPSDMEGKVIEEAFEKEFLEQHPIQYGKPTSSPSDSAFEYTQEDVKKIKEKLEDIGYI
jgi:predicted AlkP superfamily phosphohydrolase/phosphomutase